MMHTDSREIESGSFDIAAIAKSFPDHASTLLIDHYLSRQSGW